MQQESLLKIIPFNPQAGRQPTLPLVNYTSVTTSAPNEVYQSSTETPDSLAFLIKNNMVFSYSIISEPEQKQVTSPLSPPEKFL
jgi:hypothetical protein